MYQRHLNIKSPAKSFFLWGPRQAGKSWLLRESLPQAVYINLLLSDEFLTYSTEPSQLRERLAHLPKGSIIVIDEVQKVPLLLDEVHSLIEEKGFVFALCGSSARKLKRGRANLLGGRAWRYELLGLSASELKEDFDLIKMLNRGYLPSHYQEDEFFFSLQSYVSDYLKEEILSEGLTRNLPIFSRFLETAALGDSEILNFSNIGREVGVSPKTVQAYYEILQDTLIGSFLPSYTKRKKRRTVLKPKFYFHDVGIVNYLCRRHQIEVKTPSFGKAFENWVFHELQCFIKYSRSEYPLHYWQLTTGTEVDFILGDMETAIEVKGSQKVVGTHLKNLRELKKDFPLIKNRIVVCLEKYKRITEDGIHILPYQDFIEELWSNSLRPDIEICFSKN